MRAVLVLFIFAHLCTATPPVSVQTTLTPDHFLVAHVRVGTSDNTLHLQPDFYSDKLVIGVTEPQWHLLQTQPRAVSASLQLPEHADIVVLGHEHIVMPVEYIRKSQLPSHNIDGYIGLGRQSVVWQHWAEATFAVGEFRFGGLNELLHIMRHAQVPLIECLNTTTALCTFEGRIDGDTYDVHLFQRDNRVHLPDKPYTAYVDAQNVYHHKLRDIHIDVFGHETQEQCVAWFQSNLFRNVQSCDESYRVVIEPHMYLQKRDGVIVNTIVYNDASNTSVVLGNNIMTRFVVYINHYQGILALKPHRVRLKHTAIESALWFILLLVWLLYITFETKALILDESGLFLDTTSRFIIVLEITGYTLSVWSALPLAIYRSDRRVLADYYILDRALFPVIVAFALIGISATAIAANRRLSTNQHFRVYLIRLFSFDFVVTFGIWFAWIELRTHTLGGLVTASLVLFLLFRFGFIFAFGAMYTLYFKTDYKPVTSTRWFLVIIFQVIIFVAFIPFAYHYNVHPAVVQSFGIYTPQTAWLAVLLMSFIAVFGAARATSYKYYASKNKMS